jgi:hypothetical protein
MAGKNEIRPFHVIVAWVAAVLSLVLLAIHVVTWCEPKVPADDLYVMYIPFHWLRGPSLLALFIISIGAGRLFPKRPQTNWPYYAMLIFFPTYWFACESQRTATVLRNAAGWWATGKYGGGPLTEPQAFHAMWTGFKADSVLYLGFAFVAAYVLVGSCLRAWWQSRIRERTPQPDDIVSDQLTESSRPGQKEVEE